MTIIREADGYWLTLEETISVHHEEVYACFTTVGGLMRWFPVDAEIDCRTGGTIVFYWDREKSHKSTVAILNYDPGGEIVWDWYCGPGDVHAPVYWSVVPDVENGSIVKLRQGPVKCDMDNMPCMMDEAVNWTWQLCNLRSVLETKHDMRKVKPL